MFTDALSEFRADWLLAGKARSTIDGHLTLLRLLAEHDPDPGLPAARRWAASSPTLPMRRKRIQAVRAFGRWSESIGDNDFPWWQRLPVPTEPEKPQPTATLEDYNTALTRLTRPRDKAIVALLWRCGLRRAELARLAKLGFQTGPDATFQVIDSNTVVTSHGEVVKISDLEADAASNEHPPTSTEHGGGRPTVNRPQGPPSSS